MTELETKIYISLGTRSRRALKKTQLWNNRKPKEYWPRRDLISRLTRQFSLSETEAYNVLLSIREKVLRESRRVF